MGTVEKFEYVPIRLAQRPPSLRSVAAVPVPVPLCGPGKLSGVKAYMMAYSKFPRRPVTQENAKLAVVVLAPV